MVERSVGDHAAMIDDHDPIASLFGFVQMVCRQQDRSPRIAKLVQHFKNPLAALRIDPHGRLIQQQDAGRMHHATR